MHVVCQDLSILFVGERYDAIEGNVELLTTHTAHDLVKNEKRTILVADRLHGLEVAFGRWYDTCSSTNNGLCNN